MWEIVKPFLWWCANLNIHHVSQSKTEHNKYASIGLAVFLTGVFAGTFGGNAMSWIYPDSILKPILFGFFWGLTIFNLDRFIVGESIKTVSIDPSNIARFGLRIGLAVSIAVTISIPLELSLFSSSIKDYIANVEGREEYLTKLNKLNSERDYFLKKYNKSLETNDGKSNLYRDNRKNWDIKIEVLEINRKKQIKKRREEIEKNPSSLDFLTRYSAFSKMKSSDKDVSTVSWGIFLIFVMVELIPIFLKMLSARGPYDLWVEKELENDMNKNT